VVNTFVGLNLITIPLSPRFFIAAFFQKFMEAESIYIALANINKKVFKKLAKLLNILKDLFYDLFKLQN